MEKIILTLTANHPGWDATKKTAFVAKFKVTERSSPCFLVERDDFGVFIKFEDNAPGEIFFPWAVIADIEYPQGRKPAGKK